MMTEDTKAKTAREVYTELSKTNPRFKLAPPRSGQGFVIGGAQPHPALTMRREEIIREAMANNPGLTREEAEEMLKEAGL